MKLSRNQNLFLNLSMYKVYVDEYPNLIFQLDTVWFWKYLPTSWGRISEAKQVGNELHDFAVRKINERKEHMEHSDESTDFITAYLREVKKSEGKLEDRYEQIIQCKSHNCFSFTCHKQSITQMKSRMVFLHLQI